MVQHTLVRLSRPGTPFNILTPDSTVPCAATGVETCRVVAGSLLEYVPMRDFRPCLRVGATYTVRKNGPVVATAQSHSEVASWAVTPTMNTLS